MLNPFAAIFSGEGHRQIQIFGGNLSKLQQTHYPFAAIWSNSCQKFEFVCDPPHWKLQQTGPAFVRLYGSVRPTCVLYIPCSESQDGQGLACHNYFLLTNGIIFEQTMATSTNSRINGAMSLAYLALDCKRLRPLRGCALQKFCIKEDRFVSDEGLKAQA